MYHSYVIRKLPSVCNIHRKYLKGTTTFVNNHLWRVPFPSMNGKGSRHKNKR